MDAKRELSREEILARVAAVRAAGLEARGNLASAALDVILEPVDRAERRRRGGDGGRAARAADAAHVADRHDGLCAWIVAQIAAARRPLDATDLVDRGIDASDVLTRDLCRRMSERGELVPRTEHRPRVVAGRYRGRYRTTVYTLPATAAGAEKEGGEA